MRRQAEITRRLVEEWGFAPEDVLTRPDGFLKGAGVQTVDGKPVYNVCVRIPGTYGARPDAVSYKGQLPKVVLEGHIDTVNPAVLPPAETPYEAVKLQKVNEPIVKTRDELKALPCAAFRQLRKRCAQQEETDSLRSFLELRVL